MYKLLRIDVIEPRWMIGVDPAVRGPRAARADQGLEASPRGRRLAAQAGRAARPDLRGDLGLRAPRVRARATPRPASAAIDLTPAAVGPAVIPPVNGDEHLGATNVNMITCGGQATIPMVAAVSRVDAGVVRRDRRLGRLALGRPGHPRRTSTSSPARPRAGVETIGGAERGKAIIILNPAEPPMIMRDTIFCAVAAGRRPRRDRPSRSSRWSTAVQEYVPGYRLLQEPQFDDAADATRARPRSAIFVEVEGAGDYLPPYSGNLDIMTAAATQVGENIADGSLDDR